MKLIKVVNYFLTTVMVITLIACLNVISNQPKLIKNTKDKFYILTKEGTLGTLEYKNTAPKVEKVVAYTGVEQLLCSGFVGNATKTDVQAGVTFWNAKLKQQETGTYLCANPTGNAGPQDVLNGVKFWNANTQELDTGTFTCTVPTGAATALDVDNGVTFWNANTNQQETGTRLGNPQIKYVGTFLDGTDYSQNITVTKTMNISSLLTAQGIEPSSITLANFVQFSGLKSTFNWDSRSSTWTFNSYSAYDPATGNLTRSSSYSSYNSGNVIDANSPIVVVLPD